MRVIVAVASIVVCTYTAPVLPAPSPCDDALPQSLAATLSENYKEYRVVTLQMLPQLHQKHYRKDHPRGCPGISKLDFYGTGARTYAVLLRTEANRERAYELILAEPTQGRIWKLTAIDFAPHGPPPVVWAEGPGTYKGAHGDQTLVAKYPVLVFVGYESWAIVYSWTGVEIRKVWVSD